MFIICQIAVQDYSKVAYGSDRSDSYLKNSKTCHLIVNLITIAFQLTETLFSPD